MTSGIHAGKDVTLPHPIPEADDHSTCLCCLHFAVDFDSMPELMKNRRPSRVPKRMAVAADVAELATVGAGQ